MVTVPTTRCAHNEMWTYDKVEPILINYDKLRYKNAVWALHLAGAGVCECHVQVRVNSRAVVIKVE
jgi:hypothetical protein